MRKIQVLMLGLLTFVISTCSTGSGRMDSGVRETSRYSVVYEGPEIQATVRHYQAERDLGGEWLILVAHLQAGGVAAIFLRGATGRGDGAAGAPELDRQLATHAGPPGTWMTVSSQKAMSVSPTLMMSPLDRRHSSTFTALTQVPLVLPRSLST